MDVDAEGARWAQDANVTWCDSAEALVSAVGQGAVDVEVGAAEGGPILAALSQAPPSRLGRRVALVTKLKHGLFWTDRERSLNHQHQYQ